MRPILIGLSALLLAPGGAAESAPAPSSPPVVQLGSLGCRPSCKGRRCGSDGCGGTCGACAKGRYCHKNRCVKGSGHPCRRLAGTWAGTYHLSTPHHLRGRVRGHGKACRARFRITFAGGWVVQDFYVTFKGATVRFMGYRIVSRRSAALYYLDTFTGSFNNKRDRFNGTLRDAGNITGPVTLHRR